jgi:hypothetical protein
LGLAGIAASAPRISWRRLVANHPLTSRRTLLRVVLGGAGVFLLVGLYPLSRIWPEGFGWSPPHPGFERMITAIYASLGAFLLLAARRPERYVPIIDFTIVSSLAHGAVMAVDAWREPANRLHLATDIPGLFVLAVLLLALRRAATAGRERDAR